MNERSESGLDLRASASEPQVMGPGGAAPEEQTS
jgi:hypothetical protein